MLQYEILQLTQFEDGPGRDLRQHALGPSLELKRKLTASARVWGGRVQCVPGLHTRTLTDRGDLAGFSTNELGDISVHSLPERPNVGSCENLRIKESCGTGVDDVAIETWKLYRKISRCAACRTNK